MPSRCSCICYTKQGVVLFELPIPARRIAQDVFRAAFGYSMPDHFKEEIKRIADQKLICIRHRMYVRIQPLDHDTVRVTTCVERTIKNIGPGSEYLPGIVHMDDWGF